MTHTQQQQNKRDQGYKIKSQRNPTACISLKIRSGAFTCFQHFSRTGLSKWTVHWTQSCAV